MTRPGLALLLTLALLPRPGAAEPQQLDLSGEWDTPIGQIRISDLGDEVTGTLTSDGACGFGTSAEILKATLTEDTLTGQLRYCRRGPGCDGEDWAFGVLLVGGGGQVISGSVHLEAQGCQVPGFAEGSGIMFQRIQEARPDTKGPAGPQRIGDGGGYNPMKSAPGKRAKDALREGEALLHSGRFEAARREFEKAAQLDPRNPVAHNGIGVTYYARRMYDKALVAYKKALEVQPNFGDAYYNTACIYALQNKPEMALKYLRIALLNGFVDFASIRKDKDLDSLRPHPEFKRILTGDF